MKKILEKIRKNVIIVLSIFSLLVTLSNYFKIYAWDIFNSNHYPRTYSILMVMIWLYILILGRKRIFETLKDNKKSIVTIVIFILTIVSLFATIRVWASDYKYTNLILFSFINLWIIYIETNKKVKR